VTAIYVDNYNGQERIIAGVEKNGLFISTDGGRSWSQKIGGLGSSYQALKIGATDTARMYVSSLYGEFGCVLYRSDDGGKGWKLIMDDISKIFSKRISSCYPAIDSKNVLYAFQKSALAKSENGGDSWEFILHPSIEYFSPVGESRWVYTNPYVPGPVYFVTEHKPHVYYSFDSGRSWQASTSSSRDYWDSPRLFFAHKSGVIYNADNNGGLEMSADAGKSWRACNGDDPNGGDPANKNSDSFLAIDPRDNNRLILATAGRGIEISTDGCLSWHQSNNGLDSWFVNTVAMDTNNPDILYAGTDGGAYVSTDDGKTWGQVNDGLLGATVVYSIVVDKDSNVYAATPYGVFKLEKK
jgi:photosystem II stability/assembly factor-like uncharacterized protein